MFAGWPAWLHPGSGRTGARLTVVTVPAARPSPPGAGPEGEQRRPARPLVIMGAAAAAAAAGTGLAVLTLLAVIGWTAAPHGGQGLDGVLRTAAVLWLIGHHAGLVLRGYGPVGLLPLGLTVLPGALLCRAGRWVVRACGVRRLAHVGYTALALAVPYGLIAGTLAAASRTARLAPALPEAGVAAFLIALVAGGLGAARALAPWADLAGLLPERLRSVTVGTLATLGVLAGAGAAVTGAALAGRLGEFAATTGALGGGVAGAGLLLLAQLAYLPNAVIWGIAYSLGPGFTFGTGTIVAPTGSALGRLPSFPLLVALPSGVHASVPPYLAAASLALPYLAGGIGGLLVIRAAPASSIETAAAWGFAAGLLSAAVLGVAAGAAGGPLGAGRLSAAGPSGWQVAAVAALELGVSAAVTAGTASWLRIRRGARRWLAAGGAGTPAVPGPADPLWDARRPGLPDPADEHTIYLDRRADERCRGQAAVPGPADLP
jgi:hypothetical protein